MKKTVQKTAPKKAASKSIKSNKITKLGAKQASSKKSPLAAAKTAKAAAPKIKNSGSPAIQVHASGGKGKRSAEEQLRRKLVNALDQMAEEAEVVLTNADGKQYCKAPDCDNVGTSHGYCRLHYIANWKRNKNKLKILSGGMLDKYIEELTSRYPDKYVEIMRKDLSSEKDFHSIISEMELEDAEEAETFEEDTKFMEEVRGSTITDSTGDDEF